MLAVDAASPALLRSWAADGTLPNLAAFLATGLQGDSRSIEGLFDGATWPSFYTGLNPAGHRFYWLDQLVAGSYRIQACRTTHFVPRKSLWDVLSEAGRRVLVLDVPLAEPSAALNGAQLVEWGCHDAIFGYQSRPGALQREVLRAVGAHPAPEPCDATRTLADYREFTARLVRGAAAKARLTRELLGAHDWDFAIQVFSEAHCGGHQLWHLHDPAHPGFDPAARETCEDPVRQVYRALDAAIGEILAGVPPDTTVVLLDLHGMTVPGGANLLLPDILLRLGVMRRFPRATSGGDTVSASPASAAGFLRTTYHRLPEGIRRPLYQARQRVNQRLGRGSPMDLDPGNSKCFDVPIGAANGAIRLNLEGREPRGTVAPGTEAERFCEQLIHALREVRCPETGRPLVHRVLRTADLFRGAYSDDLPDLLIEWDPEHRLGSAPAGGGAGALLRAYSDRIGSLEAVNINCRTGQHRPEGMFVVRGPGIGVGSLTRVVSTLDLAPTFARMLGVELREVDGTPIPELLPDHS